MRFSVVNRQWHFITLFFTSLFFLNCKKEEKSILKSYLKEVKNDSLKSPKIKLDDFHIFEIYPLENGDQYNIFISLSDIYTDSLSIPPEIIKNQKNISFNELKHFELPPHYREKLLQGSKLKETDSLYLYNYKSNILEKFPIKSLKAVANLNLYTSEGEEIQEHYYMIGFQLRKTENEEDAMNKSNFSFAYFGKQNPFNNKALTPMKWKQISATQFPSTKKYENLHAGNVYQNKTNQMEYFILDLIDNAQHVSKRKLVVSKNKKIIFETIYSKGEGAEFKTLEGFENSEFPNYQFTGNLFKGKPPVIFGFVSESFGCNSITFLDQNYPEIYTDCDNRH